MLVIISGKQINLNSINTNIDRYFCELYAASIGNGYINVDSYKNDIFLLLSNNISNWSLHDMFFNNYAILWKKLLEENKHTEAEYIWIRALEPVIEWERQYIPNRVHKGTPYYFLSVTAILKGDIDKGYTYMHQALEEDVLTHNVQLPQTPSLFFASMQYEKIQQYFRDWLLIQIRYISDLIRNYCQNNRSSFTIDDFKHSFLENIPDRYILFQFSYIVSKLFLLANIPYYAKVNQFCGQIELNLLFDLTLVIDGSVKSKNPSLIYYPQHMNLLIRACRLGITQRQLTSLNRYFNTNFEQTMKDLLDNRFMIGQIQVQGLLRDIIISYGLRNHAAHNVTASPIIWQRFKEIELCVFNVLFAVVEFLY